MPLDPSFWQEPEEPKPHRWVDTGQFSNTGPKHVQRSNKDLPSIDFSTGVDADGNTIDWITGRRLETRMTDAP